MVPEELQMTKSKFNNTFNITVIKDKSPNRIKKYSTFFNLGQFCPNEKVGTKSALYVNPNHYYYGKNYWLVKATDLNRGRCIKITNDIKKIKNLIKKIHEGIQKDFNDNLQPDEAFLNEEEEKKNKFDKKKRYRSSNVIIQKYIENPFLYKGRKFDIRVWTLVTQNLDVYVFKYIKNKNREGHLKTSSMHYDVNKFDNYVHLTNYSVQKYCTDFSKYEYGNEVSFQDFQV